MCCTFLAGIKKEWQISGSMSENNITAFTRLPDLQSGEVRTQLYTSFLIFHFNIILPSTPKHRPGISVAGTHTSCLEGPRMRFLPGSWL